MIKIEESLMYINNYLHDLILKQDETNLWLRQISELLEKEINPSDLNEGL